MRFVLMIWCIFISCRLGVRSMDGRKHSEVLLRWLRLTEYEADSPSATHYIMIRYENIVVYPTETHTPSLPPLSSPVGSVGKLHLRGQGQGKEGQSMWFSELIMVPTVHYDVEEQIQVGKFMLYPLFFSNLSLIFSTFIPYGCRPASWMGRERERVGE